MPSQHRLHVVLRHSGRRRQDRELTNRDAVCGRSARQLAGRRFAQVDPKRPRQPDGAAPVEPRHIFFCSSKAGKTISVCVAQRTGLRRECAPAIVLACLGKIARTGLAGSCRHRRVNLCQSAYSGAARQRVSFRAAGDVTYAVYSG